VDERPITTLERSRASRKIERLRGRAGKCPGRRGPFLPGEVARIGPHNRHPPSANCRRTSNIFQWQYIGRVAYADGWLKRPNPGWTMPQAREGNCRYSSIIAMAVSVVNFDTAFSVRA